MSVANAMQGLKKIAKYLGQIKINASLSYLGIGNIEDQVFDVENQLAKRLHGCVDTYHKRINQMLQQSVDVCLRNVRLIQRHRHQDFCDVHGPGTKLELYQPKTTWKDTSGRLCDR
jgi:hypothetical protein